MNHAIRVCLPAINQVSESDRPIHLVNSYDKHRLMGSSSQLESLNPGMQFVDDINSSDCQTSSLGRILDLTP